MKSIRKLLIWIWLLTKRLYKKPSFIVILLLIPLTVVGYDLATQGESGMVTVVVCCEDDQDQFALQLQQRLTDSSGIIRFITEPDINAAQQMVYDGTAAAAWIIQPHLYDEILNYVSGEYSGNGFVKVVIRERTVPLMLLNEKLSAKLFVETARICFLNYFRENAPEFNDVSDEEILANFDKERFNDSLFVFSYIDSSVNDQNSLDYLKMPVRGMLAILILISGFAASMYYIFDDNEGVFGRISLNHRPAAEFIYLLLCIGNVALFALLSMVFSGQTVGLLTELLCLFVYVYLCSAFCRLLRIIFRNIRMLATLMSVTTAIMIFVCPVFISLPPLRIPALLFPPTYFIQSAYNWNYLIYMIIYSAALSICYHLLVPILDK